MNDVSNLAAAVVIAAAVAFLALRIRPGRTRGNARARSRRPGRGRPERRAGLPLVFVVAAVIAALLWLTR